MAMCVTMSSLGLCNNNTNKTLITTASFSLLAGSKKTLSISAAQKTYPLLDSSFFATSSISLSSRSSFSGSSLGVDMSSSGGPKIERNYRLVVTAKKFLLCQTKRNRSRKSLARTHGFRVRMSTTSGRAVLKRRRAKGRWILCTKTNHNSGKRP